MLLNAVAMLNNKMHKHDVARSQTLRAPGIVDYDTVSNCFSGNPEFAPA